MAEPPTPDAPDATHPAAVRRPLARRARGPWPLVWLLFTAVGVAWALLVPVAGSADEPDHLIKAAAVVRGQLAGPQVRCHSVVATVLGGRGVACGAQDADGDGSGGDLHGSEGGVVGAQDRQAPRSLSVGDLAGDPAELDEDARVQDGYR